MGVSIANTQTIPVSRMKHMAVGVAMLDLLDRRSTSPTSA